MGCGCVRKVIGVQDNHFQPPHHVTRLNESLSALSARIGIQIRTMTSRRKDSAQLQRQWVVLRLLTESGRSFSVKELADQVGCSKSTIERDLATLEGHFALVEEDAGKTKRRYRINQKIAALESITFGAMELMALHAALKMMTPLAGTPIYSDLQIATGKIRGFLAKKHNGGLDKLASVFLPHARGSVDYENFGDIIDDLVTAISQYRVCHLHYQSAWREHAREMSIHPLQIVWHDGALYLYCRTTESKAVITIAIHRILELRESRTTFPPPRADVDGVAQRAFGIYEHSGQEEDVEILFSEHFAWKVEERTYHPDETKERLPDGRLRYTIRSSAQWEIIPWVLKFGGEAELVSPKQWRAELSQCAAKAAAMHTNE